jgi:undecaprenyl pyrophosphate synthase
MVVSDYKEITEGVATLRQVPVHIGLVVDSKVIRTGLVKEEIINLLSWCVFGGIQYVTIHDQEGLLKMDIKDLREEVKKRISVVFGMNKSLVKFIDSPKQVILKKDLSQLLSKNNRTSNETISQNGDTSFDTDVKCSLCVTSAEDGQECIVLAARKIVESVQLSEVDLQDIRQYNFMNGIITSIIDFIC